MQRMLARYIAVLLNSARLSVPLPVTRVLYDVTYAANTELQIACCYTCVGRRYEKWLTTLKTPVK